jgi:hypothetical protein
MVKTRNRLVAAFLTLAMLLNFSAPLAAYADGEGENTGEEQSDCIELKWYSTLTYDFDNWQDSKYVGEVSVYYPIGTDAKDCAEIQNRLKEILACTTWKTEYTYCYPVDASLDPLLTDANGDAIQTGAAFLDYVNKILLAEPVNSHHYIFTSGVGATLGGGTPTAPDGYQLYDGNDGADSNDNNDGNDGDDGDDDSNIPFTVTPSSDDGSGSGSVSEPDTALGVVAAPSAESDVVSDLVTAAGLLTVAGQLALVFTWDILPIHQVEGTLTDANGAAVANARVTLEKNGQTVKTVTTDASGHFKAYVPQGEYNLFATRGEESAIYTAYTPDEGTSAELMLA